uniref:Capsid fiber protein n=1 Tax=Corynebacterium phage HS01 TaxID=3056389 RepID=A0AA50AC71_9VIRU|nr:MAG: capsid fiber protein [Corynebacterium phage HS01]
MSTVVHYTPAQNPTVKAQADLKAGTFIQLAGDIDGRNPVAKTAGAGAQVFGVPATDVAKDGYVMVYRAGHIVEVESNGAIAAGDPVAAAASGKATKAAEAAPVVGIAVSAAANNRVIVALK